MGPLFLQPLSLQFHSVTPFTNIHTRQQDARCLYPRHRLFSRPLGLCFSPRRSFRPPTSETSRTLFSISTPRISNCSTPSYCHCQSKSECCSNSSRKCFTSHRVHLCRFIRYAIIFLHTLWSSEYATANEKNAKSTLSSFEINRRSLPVRTFPSFLPLSQQDTDSLDWEQSEPLQVWTRSSKWVWKRSFNIFESLPCWLTPHSRRWLQSMQLDDSRWWLRLSNSASSLSLSVPLWTRAECENASHSLLSIQSMISVSGDYLEDLKSSLQSVNQKLLPSLTV